MTAPTFEPSDPGASPERPARDRSAREGSGTWLARGGAFVAAAWREAALGVHDFEPNEQIERLKRAPAHARAAALRFRRWSRFVLAPFVILWDAIVKFIWDDSITHAGAIAFAGLLAFFPFVIFVLTIAGLVEQTALAADAFGYVVELLPAQVGAVVQPVLDEVVQGAGGQLLTVSVAAALWAASSGLESLRHALNQAYDVDNPPAIWWRRLQSIGVTIVAAFSAIVAIVFVVLGSYLRAIVHFFSGEPMVEEQVTHLWSTAIGSVLLCLTIAGLYLVLPNKRLRFRQVLPGLILVLVGWYASVKGFSYYVTEFGRYNVTYGSLGGVVMAMLFFYISAAIFIFGAQLNAAILRWRVRMRARLELEIKIGARRPPDAEDWI